MTKPLDHTKLVKLCTLFSSAQEDEVIAAIRQANALLKASGYTWYDALGILEDKSVVEPDSELLATIDDYLEYAVWFDKNDVLFLTSIRKMVAAGSELNDRQRNWLEQLRTRVAAIDARYSDDT